MSTGYLQPEESKVDAVEQKSGRMNVLEAAAHMNHADNPRLIDSLRPSGRLLAYHRRGDDRWWYPPFQYAENGGTLPIMPNLLGLAASQRIDPMDLAFWLRWPSRSLEGAGRQRNLLRSRPNAVIGAARHDVGVHIR